MLLDFKRLFVFFFNDTATTEIYTLSLHDAFRSDPLAERLGGDGGAVLDPGGRQDGMPVGVHRLGGDPVDHGGRDGDRKSTRLNSSHANISYAVFCLKKKIIKRHILLHSLNTSEI